MNLLRTVEHVKEYGWVSRQTGGVRSQVCNSFTEKSDWGRLLNLSENRILHLYEGETRGRQKDALDFSIFHLLSYIQSYLPQGLVF